MEIVQLLLMEEKVINNIAKTSSNIDTKIDAGNLFNAEPDWPPKSFQKDKLCLTTLSEESD